jgi:transposase
MDFSDLSPENHVARVVNVMYRTVPKISGKSLLNDTPSGSIRKVIHGILDDMSVSHVKNAVQAGVYQGPGKSTGHYNPVYEELKAKKAERSTKKKMWRGDLVMSNKTLRFRRLHLRGKENVHIELRLVALTAQHKETSDGGSSLE